MMMTEDGEPLDESTQRLVMILLRQSQNAGFDLSTVEGQNHYRRTLEFSSRQMQRCETASQHLTKYGILAVMGVVFTTMVIGLKQQIIGLLGG